MIANFDLSLGTPWTQLNLSWCLTALVPPDRHPRPAACWGGFESGPSSSELEEVQGFIEALSLDETEVQAPNNPST